MAPPTTGALPSMRRQHLLSEFAGLKQACPEGVFVGLTPGDSSIWSAALFVRDGPYAPAVLRFHISFPDRYPLFPPTVTFSTDIFHPLITPLTTYMYTTDIQDNGTVSATDEERLPPGGFSLRHGFPEWFGRGKRRSAMQSPEQRQPPASTRRMGASKMITPEVVKVTAGTYTETTSTYVSAYSILKYIRSTFDDEEVLDAVPLDAAGNPGAWHAWRTHRKKLGKIPEELVDTTEAERSEQGADISQDTTDKGAHQQESVRKPGQWNWDGVWEERVKKGVAMSLSEPVLYGGATPIPDELIKFLPLEESEIDQVKENMRRAIGAETY